MTTLKTADPSGYSSHLHMHEQDDNKPFMRLFVARTAGMKRSVSE